MTLHTLSWGLTVAAPALDRWQEWPRPIRRSLVRVFSTTLRHTEEAYGPLEFVSERSWCEPARGGGWFLTLEKTYREKEVEVELLEPWAAKW